MKYSNKTMRTKRGNEYRPRATKLATGFSKVLADKRPYRYKVESVDLDTTLDELDAMMRIRRVVHERSAKHEDLIRLAVKGTTDTLNGLQFLIKRITVKHPTDLNYTKEVYALNDSGKAKYKRLLKNKNI